MSPIENNYVMKIGRRGVPKQRLLGLTQLCIVAVLVYMTKDLLGLKLLNLM